MRIIATLAAKKKVRAYWIVGTAVGLLLVGGASTQASAVAEAAFGPSFSESFTSMRDPHAFRESLVVPLGVTTVPLTREDAVTEIFHQVSPTLTRAESARVARVLCEEADRANTDPFLLLAVVGVESNFNHLAVSPVGAEGLMQLMPYTARVVAKDYDLDWSRGNSFDPELNVRLGSRYLMELHGQFRGRWDLALTAYNRGPRATWFLVSRNGGLPDEIRDFYASKVFFKFGVLRALYGHLPPA